MDFIPLAQMQSKLQTKEECIITMKQFFQMLVYLLEKFILLPFPMTLILSVLLILCRIIRISSSMIKIIKDKAVFLNKYSRNILTISLCTLVGKNNLCNATCSEESF